MRKVEKEHSKQLKPVSFFPSHTRIEPESSNESCKTEDDEEADGKQVKKGGEAVKCAPCVQRSLFYVRCCKKKRDKEQAKKAIEEYLGMREAEREEDEEEEDGKKEKNGEVTEEEEVDDDDIKKEYEDEWKDFVENYNRTPSLER